ncbi:proton-conducting transporter membrane subunit [Sulfobacillus thermosulfidooxidans]|uniref:proton-conducting transporter transmembrane domain-containing protein n=1 Tax=Sulfobacillus thermosulfidooxidans TaxID=28034 RepID=UPI0006B68470|nr:proton-conducting transporter membrane subunit [Sulfobacillus thermosulfidooxidans]
MVSDILWQWAHILALMIPVSLFVAIAVLRLSVTRSNSARYPIAFAAVVLSFILSFAVFLGTIKAPIIINTSVSLHRVLVLPFGFYIDRLTAVMLLLVTLVSMLVHIYAMRYMRGENYVHRFIPALTVTTLSTVMLVMANNLVMLYGFWVLTGLSVIYLVSLNCSTPWFSCRATRRMLATYVLGDIAFGLGVLAISVSYGTANEFALFHLLRSSKTQPVPVLSLSSSALLTISTLLIFGGIMARTVQFPLHAWLVDTLEAPTPVSALMHAGVVNMGGFLLARLSPLFILVPSVMSIIFFVGFLTAFYGTSVMLTQNDIKRSLVFSTVGQMGFMVMEAGLAAYAFVIFHLVSHGIFKATMFLGSGKVSHPHSNSPERSVSWSIWFLGLIFPAIVFYGISHITGQAIIDWQRQGILLLFAWAAITQATLGIFRYSRSWRQTLSLSIILALVVTAYLTAVSAFQRFLSAAIASPSHFGWPGGYGMLVLMVVILIISSLAIKFPLSQLSTDNAFASHINELKKTLYVFSANQWYINEVSRPLRFVTARLPLGLGPHLGRRSLTLSSVSSGKLGSGTHAEPQEEHDQISGLKSR